MTVEGVSRALGDLSPSVEPSNKFQVDVNVPGDTRRHCYTICKDVAAMARAFRSASSYLSRDTLVSVPVCQQEQLYTLHRWL